MKQNNDEKDLIVKCAADFLLPVTVILGLYIILHGHLTPGGGFQGGVVAAAAVALIFLAYGREETNKAFIPDALKQWENVGALIYLFLGILGILYGANFCRNVLFNHGNAGELASSGTIFCMNFSVGIKVISGIGFMLITMMGTLTACDINRDQKE